jgi:hypothetical protein
MSSLSPHGYREYLYILRRLGFAVLKLYMDNELNYFTTCMVRLSYKYKRLRPVIPVF